MSQQYQPPYTISSTIIHLIAQISEAVGRLTVLTDADRDLKLRRINCDRPSRRSSDRSSSHAAPSSQRSKAWQSAADACTQPLPSADISVELSQSGSGGWMDRTDPARLPTQSDPALSPDLERSAVAAGTFYKVNYVAIK